VRFGAARSAQAGVSPAVAVPERRLPIPARRGFCQMLRVMPWMVVLLTFLNIGGVATW
jgi:hypothetical protein